MGFCFKGTLFFFLQLQDLEVYKQTVKDELAEWQGVLRSKNIPDWLIVVVVNDESKMKTKLLPRASVGDKVKSDFCGKHPDRYVMTGMFI